MPSGSTLAATAPPRSCRQTHLACREEAEAQPEEADVERGREGERADLPGEAEAGADGRERGEDGGRERAAAEQGQQQERTPARVQGSHRFPNPLTCLGRPLGNLERPACNRYDLPDVRRLLSGARV